MDSTLHRWFRKTVAAGLVGAAVCAGTAVVLAQGQPSLAELARQEAERRKTLKASSKVVTNKDLKPAPPGAVPAPPATAPAETPQAAQDATPADAQAGETRDQAWWKGRADQLREDLRRSEVFAETIQSRINALTTEFTGRDDPYQRAKIGEDRQKMLAEMDRVKGDVERLKKALTDLEEDARRAGVPPGWLR